jgi:hypothetical protein
MIRHNPNEYSPSIRREKLWLFKNCTQDAVAGFFEFIENLHTVNIHPRIENISS